MTRGRKPSITPMVDKKICLPARLVSTWDLLLADSARGKPGYGEWSKLITRLLDEELSRIAGKRSRAIDTFSDD